MNYLNDSWEALKNDMKAIGKIKGLSWRLWWSEVKAFRKGKVKDINLTRDYDIRKRAMALKASS